MANIDNYKLGKTLGLTIKDYILAPITFEELIITLKCNNVRKEITESQVLQEYREILKLRLEEAEILIKNNLKEISDETLKLYD